ncbi:anthrone oxygenase family protein [Nonomuraea sp. NPDC059007]|uniref:anthrone oxygenase family protein n=1 Tax=Nonomuraea sp. NPDC059007 TaxID=3346692 RepID=UPI00368CFB02
MTEVALPLALLANGLSAGVLMATVLGVVPFYMTLTAGDYVRAHAFAVGRYDPFQPACLMVTVLADVLVAAAEPRPAGRLLCAAAALTAGSVVAVSLTRNVPMNRWVKAQDPDALPPGWDLDAFRRRWARWNRTRTGLALLALTLNTGAAVALL